MVTGTATGGGALRTVGVEEELMLVGPDGAPIARAKDMLGSAEPADGPLEYELMEEQIETASPPRSTLEDIAAAIREGRAGAQAAADRHDARIVAVGTSPLAIAGTTVAKLRYLLARAEFGLTAREQLTSGCHVHVAVADDAEGVAVLDRIGPWLAPLLALSANSPYWMGVDSEYASFRSQVWSRWHTAGPTRRFGTPEAYHEAVERLIASETILDEGMVYFDARLSARYPTVEIRVADVCLSADTATLLAALARGLVETAARAADSPAPDVPVEILRVALWRAGRSGLSGALLDPRTWRPAPAHDVVGALIGHVREALVDAGELDVVTELLGELWAGGDGASRQRAWAAEADGDLGAVALRAADATLG
ncbi:glutamate--cysteine ligase [Promicromonospora panici]|uniref:carboxylate-amine ligase n=1 Tax=Promicromonospora panici TaxID=2219658 RepID=UPI00101D49F2